MCPVCILADGRLRKEMWFHVLRKGVSFMAQKHNKLNHKMWLCCLRDGLGGSLKVFSLDDEVLANSTNKGMFQTSYFPEHAPLDMKIKTFFEKIETFVFVVVLRLLLFRSLLHTCSSEQSGVLKACCSFSYQHPWETFLTDAKVLSLSVSVSVSLSVSQVFPKSLWTWRQMYSVLDHFPL